MTNYTTLETAKRAVKQDAEERFPDDEWTLEILVWSDDDFKVTAKHGCGETSAENAVREEIICTPFGMRRQVVESTQSEEYRILREEVLD